MPQPQCPPQPQPEPPRKQPSSHSRHDLKSEQAQTVQSADLRYKLIRSRRKSLTLMIREDQSLEVRSPHHVPRQTIDQFVLEKASWIQKKRFESGQSARIGPLQPELIEQNKEAFFQAVNQAVERFKGPPPKKILLRDLSSRWGSCSSKGTVSLNSRLMALPAHLRDYVIYHELCHLVHMNHSSAFWALLNQYVPDAGMYRRQLNRQFRLLGRK